MVLYRTDDFNHEMRTTSFREILYYEIYEMENSKIFLNMCNLIGIDYITAKKEWEKVYKELSNDNKDFVYNYIDNLLKKYEGKIGYTVPYAIWLYPLDNVKDYYEFEGFDPLIYGYNTSDNLIIFYKDEGSLYAYHEEPKPCETV